MTITTQYRAKKKSTMFSCVELKYEYLSVFVSEDSPSSSDDNLPPLVSFSPPGSSSTSSWLSFPFFKVWTGNREKTDNSPVISKLQMDKHTPGNAGRWRTAWLRVSTLVKVNSNKAQARHTYTQCPCLGTHTNTETHFLLPWSREKH